MRGRTMACVLSMALVVGCSAASSSVVIGCATTPSDWTGTVGDRIVRGSLVDFEESPAPPSGYSGFGGVIMLDDGSYLATGFDDAAFGEGQYEYGAIWKSKDGLSWRRIGVDITRADGQQVLRAATSYGGALFVVGTNLLKQKGYQPVDMRAAAWRSDDSGDTWRQVDLPDESGTVNSILALDGFLIAAGATGAKPQDFAAALWRSADGRGWERITIEGTEILNLAENADGTLSAFGAAQASDQTKGKALGAWWTSNDQGFTWVLQPTVADESSFDWSAHEMLVAGDEAMLVGAERHYDKPSFDFRAVVHYRDSSGTWHDVDLDGFGGLSYVTEWQGQWLAVQYRQERVTTSRLAVFNRGERRWSLVAGVNESDEIDQVSAVQVVDDELWWFGRIDSPTGDLGGAVFRISSSEGCA